MIRKNISLEKDDLKKIEPIVDKHNGNLSAAIREIIGFADDALKNFGDINSAKNFERATNGVVISKGILNWLLEQTEGCLPDYEAIDRITERCDTKNGIDFSCIMNMCDELTVDHKIEFDQENPSSINVELNGKRLQTEYVAKIISCILAEKRYILSDVSKHASSISLKLDKEGSYEEIREKLLKHFGDRHVMMQEILDKPVYWNNVIISTTEWSDIQKYKFPRIYIQKKY
ncbi:MAG: hypothetical protein SVM80_08150 [Halobacteriota archaeon]|nr:hypothetical protein [Halobacteriota archaeon]